MNVENFLDNKIPSVETAAEGNIVVFDTNGTVKDVGIPASLINNKAYLKAQTPALGQVLAVADPYVPIDMGAVYNNDNANVITILAGIVTIVTGALPTVWRLFFSANVILPLDSEASFQMYNETTAAFFDTQSILTSGSPVSTLGGNGIIENILPLPANSTFVFSVRGQTPSLVPVTVGQSFQPAYLNVYQIS